VCFVHRLDIRAQVSSDKQPVSFLADDWISEYLPLQLNLPTVKAIRPGYSLEHPTHSPENNPLVAQRFNGRGNRMSVTVFPEGCARRSVDCRHDTIIGRDPTVKNANHVTRFGGIVVGRLASYEE
jgi:hypothetical protein